MWELFRENLRDSEWMQGQKRTPRHRGLWEKTEKFGLREAFKGQSLSQKTFRKTAWSLPGLILLPPFHFPQRFPFAQTQPETTVNEGHVVSIPWPKCRLEKGGDIIQGPRNFNVSYHNSDTASVRKQCRDSVIYYFLNLSCTFHC